MTKDEVAKLYIETTARKLVLRDENHRVTDGFREQLIEYHKQGGESMTVSELRSASEEAIALSGLPADNEEVAALRLSVDLAATLSEAADDIPSASEIGRRL